MCSRPSRNMLVILVSLAAAWPVGIPTVSAQTAYLQLTEKRSEREGEQQLQQTVYLAGSYTEFELAYDIAIGPDTPEGRCFSSLWVYSIGMPTLGMAGPASCNWYSQGFFDVLLDGESLREYPATFRVVRRGGPDALCTATWEMAKGTVAAHFLLRGGDDKLLMQIEWQPEAALESVELKLLCYPSWFYGDKDRWIVTPTREVQHAQTVALDSPHEPWVFYHDRGLPERESYGACALMYVPDELTDASVQVDNYPVWTTLRFKPAAGRATVALWDFTGVGADEENLAYLREHGEQILEDLSRVAGSDWQQPLTAAAHLPADRKALHGERHVFETTPYDVMTSTVSTPHRRWAKPLADGPVRALIIAPRWAQRETVELAQRLDVEYETVSVSASYILLDKRGLTLYGTYELYGYRPRSVVAVLNDLRTKLEREYDCIIVADVRNGILPQYFIDMIAQKVRAGTGLVATGAGASFVAALGQDDRQPVRFWAPVPIESLPVLRNYAWTKTEEKPALIDATTVGNGRTLVMKYPVSSRSNLALTPATTQALDYVSADYEYYQSLLAKALLWAARREPRARIVKLAADFMRVESQTRFSGIELSVHVHDRDGRTEWSQRRMVNLSPGANELRLELTVPRGGEHFLDVALRQDGSVIDWASTWFETTSETAITEVSLDKTVLAAGDTLRGLVRLRGIEARSRLDARLIDSLDRVVARQRIVVEPGAVEKRLRVKLLDPLTVVHRLEVTLSDALGERDWTHREVTAPDRRLDDFMFLVWSSGHNNHVRSAINQVLAEAGVDTIDNVGLTQSDGPTMAASCRNAARRNLRSVPYITRIASMQGTGLVRRPCLTDPEHLSEWTSALRERAQAAAPYGPPAYTLGDENFLVRTRLDVCSSPTCLANFRDYLREIYGNLRALSREWDAEFESWEQVTPITLDEARETKQYARWADHRRYMDSVFTQAHALGRSAIRQADPGARVGFDGVFSLDSWHGYDFYQLVRACDLNQVYARRFNQVEYLRSFHQPDALLGAWHNRIGNDDEISARRVAWHLLFHGFNSGWYWTSYNTGPAALFPDLRPTPQLQWLAESHGEIKAGIGKLLMNADRLHDGITIHYSQASVHGNTLLDRQLPEAHWGALLAIEDLGLQYDFVSYEHIEQGALEDCRVFVMPASCAVSEKELAAIRAFVEEGGLLVADILPAVMDGRCKPLEEGALDDVFGKTISADVSTTMPDGDMPPLMPNAFGRGRALLLGFPFSDYTALRSDGNEGAFREALRDVLASHGIEAKVRVLSDGKPLSACEVVRFRNGEIEYVGIVKEDDIEDRETRQATILFPRESYVYDVRARRLLGHVARVETTITPGVPLLYALLPYSVDGLRLRPDRRRYAGGKAVTLRIKLVTGAARLAGDHVVRLEVTDPIGRARPHYAQNLLLSKPEVTARVRLALNDPAGEWTFTATDVVSGQAATARVTVTSSADST